jgi:hypothetical protein
MNRRLLFTLALAAVMALSITAVALAKTKTKTKSVSVPAGKTKIITVAYPDALKNGNAKYKCSATVTSGDKSKVKITKGSAQGGSVCQAKAVNSGKSSATVKVTASTTT